VRSNCLFFAYELYRRRRSRGKRGLVSWRWSYWGPFPHFLYVAHSGGRWRVISYTPVNPKHKKLPPPIFRGVVRWGDPVRGPDPVVGLPSAHRAGPF
jgi:hypothetical protein